MQNPNSTSETREYCSELNPAEPMWGTADTVDVWLLLEYRPSWSGRALADNGLSEPVSDWLARTLKNLAAAGFKVRPQFVRQPEPDRDDTRLLVAVNDRLYEFAGQGYDYLLELDLAALLREPARLATAAWELTEPRYLVCTNGQRDVCCARFGLPVYAALREQVGERAWQVTHLGGHRFAPNVLVLPGGCLYGRVSPEAVADFLDATEQGRVDFPRLRGRTRYDPIVQAGEACIGREDLRLMSMDGDGSRATLSFTDGHELVKVTMRRTQEAMRVAKSCGDEPVDLFPFIEDQS